MTFQGVEWSNISGIECSKGLTPKSSCKVDYFGIVKVPKKAFHFKNVDFE